jgi:hypothetical protein
LTLVEVLSNFLSGFLEDNGYCDVERVVAEIVAAVTA